MPKLVRPFAIRELREFRGSRLSRLLDPNLVALAGASPIGQRAFETFRSPDRRR
jgi:hypothetical protein